MRLYFLRHGESEANIQHEFSNYSFRHPLTDKGVAQTLEAARVIKDIDFSKVYCSPILRAIHTASILTDKLNIEAFEITDLLREYSVGVLEGNSDQESWDRYFENEKKWEDEENADERIENGESLREILLRFKKFLNSIPESYENDNVLIVTHGGLLKLVLPRIVNNLNLEFIREHPIKNCELIVLNVTAEGITCESWGGLVMNRHFKSEA